MADKITEKKTRLEAYKTRELIMLSPDGVQSYGVGTRNAQRYNTDLKVIQDMIAKLEQEIEELEGLQSGRAARKAVGVVLRDL